MVFVDGRKPEKSPLNETHVWWRAGIESNPGHTGGTLNALTTAPSLLPKHTTLFGHACLYINTETLCIRGLEFPNLFPDSVAQEHFFKLQPHVYKFSTKLYCLVTITGVDNADLMFVVPKGSKTIWVFEESADKNNIGEK